MKQFIIDYIAARTRTFGGGNSDHAEWNPLTSALVDGPPQFALGVDVGEVVDLVFKAIERAPVTKKSKKEMLGI